MDNTRRTATALALAALLVTGVAACGRHGTSAGSAPVTSGPAEAAEDLLGETPVAEEPGTPTTQPPGPAPEGQPPAPPPDPVVEPAAIDCVSYNPSNLTIEAYGDVWRMRDGNHAMLLFATKTDADDAKKVARNWKELCFIGRGNDRADRYRYIATWWRTPSGLPLGPAPAFDCVTYDKTKLAVQQVQSDWALTAGGGPLLVLATQADALRAKVVANGYPKLCFIGRDNDKANPSRYIIEFWRQ
jgi:hypothetical protein